MPSLKLSNPFRRNATRPSSQAAAAKVMTRKPALRPVADRVREMAPLHPGFVPYPPEAPMSLLRIEMAIPLKAERLLQLARREFDRLYSCQAAGRDDAGRQAVADRLRRELRIRELEAVIDPPTPEPCAVAGDALSLGGATSPASEAGGPPTVAATAALEFEGYSLDKPTHSPKEWGEEMLPHTLGLPLADRLLRMNKAEMMAFLRDIDAKPGEGVEPLHRSLIAARNSLQGWAQLVDLAGTRFLVAGSVLTVEQEGAEHG